jgi:pseudaminic acid synthase
MKSIKIANREIGEDKPCFIIAELSCNHNNSLDIAMKTIQAMKESGADCVKLQTSKPGSITIDCDKDVFKVKGGTLWDGRTLFDLYSETYTPWEWHLAIKNEVEKLGMIFFSSPFDLQAVDFLETLNVPAYKIASFEITDIPLINYVASKGKPVIISTGIADEQYIEDAIKACKDVGNDNIVLLKCTSSYPTPLNRVNLNVITTLKEKYGVNVGLSDHTEGALVAIGAVAIGACIVEKHFILNRNIGGPDASFSMEPNEFKKMVDGIRDMECALGNRDIVIDEKVLSSRSFARSLFVVENISKGEVLTSTNVKSIRPGNGLLPKYLPDIIGKTAKFAIERGTPLSFDLIN